MNAAVRAGLEQEPVPTTNGIPVEAGAHFDGTAWRTHWLVGTERRDFGLPYSSMREAAAASRYLNERGQA